MLTGLRAAPRGDVRIQITFAIDADGIVKVSAEDTESGNQVDMMVRASSRMSEIERNQLREGGETQRSEESRPPEEAQGADPFADGELEVATENDGMGLIDDETEEDDDDLDLSDDWMEST